MTVHVIVDSTSDIDADRAKSLGITIVPLTVAFGDDAFLDGVDIDNKTFYEKMAKASALPVTSTPSVEQFQRAFREAINGGATGILVISLSSALSGTLNTATLAAQEFSSVPFKLIDSRSVSAGFGLPAMLAAEKARQGASLDELASFVQDIYARGSLYFVLDTLENLRKGGRIGSAAAFIGTMLSFKPILAIKDGLVTPLERPRSRAKALTRITELVKDLGPLDYMAIAASNDTAGAEILESVRPLYSGTIEVFKLGAVIGTHAGPHAAGVFAVPAKK